MKYALIFGLIAATGIAATSIAREVELRDGIDLIEKPRMFWVEGCKSEFKRNAELRETIVYKRKRICKGEVEYYFEGMPEK